MDFNGDGRSDIISGSFPGQISLFARNSDGTFAAPSVINDRNGKPLRAGAATHVFAVDWDGDGDLDLLVGNISGEVHLFVNSGDRKKPQFDKPQHLNAGGKPISVPGGDAGPHAVDWDGDGKLDLLVGCGDGSVRWYRNTAKGKAPLLSGEQVLIAAPDDKKPTTGCGERVKIWVVDWDGDGRPDLLVGDDVIETTTITLTAAQKVAQQKAAKTLEDLKQRCRKLGTAPKDEPAAERKKRLAELEKTLLDREAAEAALAKFETTRREYHGYVWLFPRKPKTNTVRRR